MLSLQAWRAVDRAYYDKNFNGNSWFKVNTTLHKLSSSACTVCLQSC